MLEVKKIKLNDYEIEGYKGDYVLETIESTQSYYEVKILDKWTERFNKAKVILDIGANIGNHTLYFCQHINYEKIYAFEPYIPTYERLKNNIVGNQLKNVFPINKGIGNTKGFARPINIDESNMGATTLEYTNEVQEDRMETIDIDSFVEENEIKQIDLIKIDVEKFELLVLDGMQNTLKNMYPDLWIEVSLETFKPVIDKLQELDYVIVDIEGFNILCLNNKRHDHLQSYDTDKVLANMFTYLDKTNTYYKNYLVAKQWCANKDTKIEGFKIQLDKLREKYESNVNEVNKLKLENEVLSLEKEKITTVLQGLHREVNIDIQTLKEAKTLIRKLETQNNYLKHEVAEYRRKLSLITDTYWGKVGMKVYKILKKIKAKWC